MAEPTTCPKCNATDHHPLVGLGRCAHYKCRKCRKIFQTAHLHANSESPDG